jgi:hypothetical protein
VADLAGYLTGRWRLDREITDEAGNVIGTFAGTATCTKADDDVLVFHEHGTLTLDTHAGQAERTLHYRMSGEGRAAVHFTHGGFFHDVDLRDGEWRTSHPCRDDLYSGEYLVLGPDEWRLTWNVAGPAKNHVIRSDFRRLS